LSERISLSVHDLSESEKLARDLGVDKVPAVVIRGQINRPIRFFGLPYGGQFMGFVETLIDAAKGQVQLQPETIKQLRRLKNDVKLQVMVTPNCPHSPAAARMAMRFGLQSVRVKVDIIELGEFLPLAQRHAIRAVPAVVLDEKLVLQGAMEEHALAEQVLRAAEGKPYTGPARVGPGTLFAPQTNQPAPQAQQRVSSSGLILPP
jgi:alkyl hydroperoxide reductase subunit AhpF